MNIVPYTLFVSRDLQRRFGGKLLHAIARLDRDHANPRAGLEQKFGLTRGDRAAPDHQAGLVGDAVKNGQKIHRGIIDRAPGLLNLPKRDKKSPLAAGFNLSYLRFYWFF